MILLFGAYLGVKFLKSLKQISESQGMFFFLVWFGGLLELYL